MKSITLILTATFALISFSSCCCQSQSAPPLRPMIKDCGDADLPTQQPIKVFKGKGK